MSLRKAGTAGRLANWKLGERDVIVKREVEKVKKDAEKEMKQLAFCAV